MTNDIKSEALQAEKVKLSEGLIIVSSVLDCLV